MASCFRGVLTEFTPFFNPHFLTLEVVPWWVEYSNMLAKQKSEPWEGHWAPIYSFCHIFLSMHPCQRMLPTWLLLLSDGHQIGSLNRENSCLCVCNLLGGRQFVKLHKFFSIFYVCAHLFLSLLLFWIKGSYLHNNWY